MNTAFPDHTGFCLTSVTDLKCAGSSHQCNQILINYSIGCHKCFLQMCWRSATIDSLGAKNPGQRDVPDEERFRKWMKTFAQEVACELCSYSCLWLGCVQVKPLLVHFSTSVL